jgi:hypothetical protein
MTMWDQISDAEREVLVRELVSALPRSEVPEHLRPGLVRYFSDGIMPGSFLQSVLTNNLTQAVLRADLEAELGLGHLIRFLNEHAPSNAWGSREAVLAWSTTPNRLEV